MILITLIGIVCAIVVPIVANYVREPKVEPVECLISLLEFRDKGTEDLRTCPSTGTSYELVKADNKWTLRCPVHYGSYGSHPRLEKLDNDRRFTQDLPDVTSPASAYRKLSERLSLEKLSDGQILIRDSSSRISRYFFMFLGVILLLALLIALIFGVSGILHIMGTMILKALQPKKTYASADFLPSIFVTVAIILLAFLAFQSFSAAGRMDEIKLAGREIAVRTMYFGKQLSATKRLGNIETIVPLKSLSACIAIYQDTAGKYSHRMMFENTNHYLEASAVMERAVRRGASGVNFEESELSSLKQYWPAVALLIICFFLVGRNIILVYWQHNVLREWKGLAKGILTWKQSLALVAPNPDDWQMFIQENKTFFVFPYELIAFAVLLQNKRDRRMYIFKGHRHPALFASKVGVPTSHFKLSSSALKIAALRPVKIKNLPAFQGNDKVFQIAGVRFKLRAKPKAALHHWTTPDWAILKIRTMEGEVHISTPRYGFWPRYREVLQKYLEPISNVNSHSGYEASFYEEIDRPIRFLLAKPGSIDAICFIVRGQNGTCQGIVQLYHPSGEIIFECYLYASGNERQVTRELFYFLCGIESPQGGDFGQKRAAINDIQTLLKTYFRNN